MAQEAYDFTASRGGLVRSDAQQLSSRLGLDCVVSDALVRGQDVDGRRLYEVGCLDADGFLIQDGLSPRAIPCLLLRHRENQVGQRCTLPSNRNTLSKIQSLARNAGIGCDVDDGMIVGHSPSGAMIYEIGCRRESGFRVEDNAEGLQSTPCAALASSQNECRFTDTAEMLRTANRWFQPRGVDCDTRQLRYMGAAADARYIEARCSNDLGYMVKFDANWRLIHILTCEAGKSIGGGCLLLHRRP